ncbi:MAG: LysR family transcriptional regulator [Alphaproteobacteria bacterium]|nr:LysR family transcriptional regulator [Alphaproteobacteria bacterium]
MMNRLLSYLRLADLELFITAGHLRSLGKAASFHNLSQSAASAAILRVEAAFERPLCTHEKRQFRLTSEGATLVPKAEEWLKQFRDTIATDAPRPIRVATTHAIARAVIPAILSVESVDLNLMRPDGAYGAVLMDEADIALVLDNAPWEEVISVEVGAGSFQLYSSISETPLAPVILPENQIEVLSLMQRWEQTHKKRLEIKARIPSWSLIADICADSHEVGFLPDFLAKKAGLWPVSWQPKPSRYRILALHRPSGEIFQMRLNRFINQCREIFASS